MGTFFYPIKIWFFANKQWNFSSKDIKELELTGLREIK
jgi:hypothetical protein